MKDTLACIGPSVYDEPIPRLRDALSTRHLAGDRRNVIQQAVLRIRKILQRCQMANGDDQYVDRRNRMLVAKCKHAFIAVEYFRRRIPACDLAERARGFGKRLRIHDYESLSTWNRLYLIT